MGTFEELLGYSQPQADEFASYRIGPNGRIYITIYRKPDTPPPEGDRDQRGTLDGGAGVFGPSRTVDAEGRPMSDFREAFLPTWSELITRRTREMETMRRLREAGGYTTRDDDEGSPPVGEFAVDGDNRRWPLNPPSSSYSPPNRFGEGIKDLPEDLRGPTAPGVPAPFVAPPLRPLVAEPAPSLTSNKGFGERLEFPAGLASPIPASQFKAPASIPGPREPEPYMGASPLTDGGYSQVSRTPYQGELTDFSSYERKTRPDPIPLDRPIGVPFVRPTGVPPVRPNKGTEGAGWLNERLLALYTWLSALNSPERRAVIVFRAREFQTSENDPVRVERILELNRKQVEDACPLLEVVQTMTDDAASKVRRLYPKLTGGPRGTKVHWEVEQDVNGTDEKPRPFENLVAEESLWKARAEAGKNPLPLKKELRRGLEDTIRVDVLEDVGNKTICVYDIKTGRRALYIPRMFEIARSVAKHYEGTRRIIVTEIRPSLQ